MNDCDFSLHRMLVADDVEATCQQVAHQLELQLDWFQSHHLEDDIWDHHCWHVNLEPLVIRAQCLPISLLRLQLVPELAPI